MDKALVVENLSFQYPGYPEVRFPRIFDGLCLSLDRGEMGLLLGRPDSGKTTLSRILTSLAPRHTGGTIEGRITLMGRDISTSHPYDLIERVGLVFQNPEEQIITTRCDTEVAFALESLGFSRDKMVKRIEEAFRVPAITHLMERDPATLSGGEQKKILFACLCAIDPDIYILDEFFEEIDPPSRMSILSYLKDRGKTVLILSAKLLEVYQDYMDKIFLLSEGKISENTEGRFPGQGRLSGRGRLSGQGRLSGPLLVRAENEGVAFRTPPDELIRSTEENTGLLLEAEDLSFRYSKHSDSGASPGFTLSVERFVLGRGETVSLVGRNGSGKSTLGKIISGLIVPEKGRIRIRTGSGLIDASPQLLNGTVAYMFQNPDLQIFLPTLRDELSFGLKRSGLSETDIESKVLRAIELFELPGPDMPPTLMSYGARKRLQAAVYHLLNRPLVILDEADSGLSYNNFFDILSLFSQQKCAVIAITHDIRLAKAISNRIILMKQGRFLSTIERSRFDEVEKLMEQEDAEL